MRARIITGMQFLKRSPLPHSPLLWLMLLAALWACLGAQTLGLKTASGQIYGLQVASWDATALQAPPRLGFDGLAEKYAPAPPVGAKGGTATKVTTGELAGTADQVFPGVSKGTYNPSGSVLGQATGDSCAAGCTRMAAVPDVPEFYIRDAIGTQANQGTNLANIPSGLKDLGYKGNASYTANATVDTVAQQTASGNAVIVNVKTPGGDVHAIVVDSISNGTAYIRDPLPMPGAVGSGGSAYSIPASALKNQMTGKAVYITPPSP